MIPYKPKTSEAAERRLEGAGGFLGDYIVPSQIGLPVPMGLTEVQFKHALEEIFENDDLLLDDAPTDAVE